MAQKERTKWSVHLDQKRLQRPCVTATQEEWNSSTEKMSKT